MKLIFKPSKKLNNLNFFKPIRVVDMKKIRSSPKKNLTFFQASIRYPKLTAFGDADRDGILNAWDCRPFDKKRHSEMSRDDAANRLFLKREDPKGAYKEVMRITKKHILPRGERELRQHFVSGDWKDDFARSDTMPKVDYRTHEGKSIAEGMLKRNYKLMTPMDVIKHVEKHPQLLKTLEKTHIAIVHPSRLKKIDAMTSTTGEEIAFRSSYPNRLDVGELLEHEVAHVEQGKKLRDKLRGPLKKWMEKRDEISTDEYNENPVEKDAENRRKAKRAEWESWKEEQPETLQQLDSEDIKSVEHKDED